MEQCQHHKREERHRKRSRLTDHASRLSDTLLCNKSKYSGKKFLEKIYADNLRKPMQEKGFEEYRGWDHTMRKKRNSNKKNPNAMQTLTWHVPEGGRECEGGKGGVWSILPPAHPPRASPLALKSKTCIIVLHRARRSHTHWAKHTNITLEKSPTTASTRQSRRTQNKSHYSSH